MAPIPRKRSLADMQNADAAVPAEYNDDEYFFEVLQLKQDQSEALLDEKLAQEAERLGITIPKPATANSQDGNSICESAPTEFSNHARTASSGSQGSVSTDITSRSSDEHLDNSAALHPKKPSVSRRSLSFTEYDKYLVQHEAQQEVTKSNVLPAPMPSEPTPSLFSVSTRHSYASIKFGIKSKLRLRREKTNHEAPK
jgi:hypothetical protein